MLAESGFEGTHRGIRGALCWDKHMLYMLDFVFSEPKPQTVLKDEREIIFDWGYYEGKKEEMS